jgi:alpha,alpha-trehalase
MFPWQGGSDGREETQTMHLNPRSGRWLPDNSYLQRHVSLAVAYNVWKYYEWTGDAEFMSDYGAELFLEVLRFMAGLATFNEDTRRWDIRGVMGPDEFHDSYPDAEQPGIDNNSYTNVMTAWMAGKANEVLATLPEWRRRELTEMLQLTSGEAALWEELSRRLTLIFDDGILSQFEGYDALQEFDWEGYRARYGDIHRLDRILEAEGDTANRYKLSKQADTTMLFYLLPFDELSAVIERLGYRFAAEDAARTIAYHEQRSSHGSTLSRAVYAWVMAESNPAAAWKHFAAALESDLRDIQGGTTREGVHLGVMAGTVDLVERGYTGLEVRDNVLRFAPHLPAEIAEVSFSMVFHGQLMDIVCTHRELVLTMADTTEGAAVPLVVNGAAYALAPGPALRLPL